MGVERKCRMRPLEGGKNVESSTQTEMDVEYFSIDIVETWSSEDGLS